MDNGRKAPEYRIFQYILFGNSGQTFAGGRCNIRKLLPEINGVCFTDCILIDEMSDVW